MQAALHISTIRMLFSLKGKLPALLMKVNFTMPKPLTFENFCISLQSWSFFANRSGMKILLKIVLRRRRPSTLAPKATTLFFKYGHNLDNNCIILCTQFRQYLSAQESVQGNSYGLEIPPVIFNDLWNLSLISLEKICAYYSLNSMLNVLSLLPAIHLVRFLTRQLQCSAEWHIA